MGKPFHLAWFLQGSSAQAWGEAWTGHIGTSWMVPELFLDMARTLERACFDYVLIEDSSYIGESYGGSTEIYLKNAIAVPRQDPSVVAALMTQVTSRIGIVPTFGTYAYHPYLLARLMATLDQVSAGRIGWNAVTGSSDHAAMNFGLPGMPEHDLRYDMADEYMAVVPRLWGSWEPGAIVADRESGVLVDPDQGPSRRFRREMVLQNARPAQFRPGAAGPAGHRAGRRLAARPRIRRPPRRHDRRPPQGHRRDESLSRRRAPPHGGATAATPTCKVLFMIAPILGETEEEAQEQEARRAARAAEHRPAPGAFRQGDQYRFRQDRPRQADLRPNSPPTATSSTSISSSASPAPHPARDDGRSTTRRASRSSWSARPTRSPRAWARSWRRSAATASCSRCPMSAAAPSPRSRTGWCRPCRTAA
jgi:alkanesulfonate monooxygenase SsuD/methylene tetrahydromethanopterin reductase-like flavin-dependent oxidoreductase (luciferase family)